MATRTHYDELGIGPGASIGEVRDAYRRLAREYHPDRTAASAAGSDRMPRINEAYRVLSDPARRAVYDAGLRGGGPMRTSPRDDPDDGVEPYVSPATMPPIAVPWRTIAVCAVVAIVGVVVLAQFTDPGEPPGPDGILRSGDCVEIAADLRANEVECIGEGDLVVRALVPFDQECRTGWELYRDRQGMGNACIERT